MRGRSIAYIDLAAAAPITYALDRTGDIFGVLFDNTEEDASTLLVFEGWRRTSGRGISAFPLLLLFSTSFLMASSATPPTWLVLLR